MRLLSNEFQWDFFIHTGLIGRQYEKGLGDECALNKGGGSSALLIRNRWWGLGLTSQWGQDAYLTRSPKQSFSFSLSSHHHPAFLDLCLLCEPRLTCTHLSSLRGPGPLIEKGIHRAWLLLLLGWQEKDQTKAASDFGLKVILPQIPLGNVLSPHLSFCFCLTS